LSLLSSTIESEAPMMSISIIGQPTEHISEPARFNE
jgi:hypothetical protein